MCPASSPALRTGPRVNQSRLEHPGILSSPLCLTSPLGSDLDVQAPVPHLLPLLHFSHRAPRSHPGATPPSRHGLPMTQPCPHPPSVPRVQRSSASCGPTSARPLLLTGTPTLDSCSECVLPNPPGTRSGCVSPKGTRSEDVPPPPTPTASVYPTRCSCSECVPPDPRGSRSMYPQFPELPQQVHTTPRGSCTRCLPPPGLPQWVCLLWPCSAHSDFSDLLPAHPSPRWQATMLPLLPANSAAPPGDQAALPGALHPLNPT